MKQFGGQTDAFEGPSILMMLYANGFGVRRDLDLSIWLACASVDGAPAEIEGRVEHLKKMKTGDTTGVFDLCDDITSGYMMGMCRGILSELKDVKRNSSIGSVMRNWKVGDRVAYKTLRKAASIFFDERLTSEVDESRTARAMFISEESDDLEEIFADEIMKSDQCNFIPFSSKDFIRADSTLNKLYATVMRTKTPSWGTTTKKGIKRTQRSWIRYRNAWVLFAKQKCPELNGNALETLLTKERIEQLRVFADK